jgi:DNA-binding GntR family transcriptional regulator
VREALLELQSCGLVEARDNRGIFVGELTPRKFLEYLDVRAVLEGLAASLCCEHMSRAEIRELKETAEAIRKAGKENRIEDDIALDRVFITACCRFQERYLPKSLRLWPGEDTSAQAEPDTTFREHMAIIHAIEKGNPQDAEQRMRDHIVNSKHLIEERIKDGSFEPLWLKPKRLKEKNS